MPATVSISDDGQTWREITREEFDGMLACISVDCWVDLSTPGKMLHMTLSAIRNLRECEGPLPGMPHKRATHLYGIPIISARSRTWHPGYRCVSLVCEFPVTEAMAGGAMLFKITGKHTFGAIPTSIEVHHESREEDRAAPAHEG